MAIYSIKDLAKLSGIKAHTLRIWEQRYGIVTPQRTPTNIRYYQDEDLRLILNIAFLNRNGFKISKIAKMTQEERSQKVATLSDSENGHATQLDALTIAMIELDEVKFDRIISSNIHQFGFERTMLEIIYPFLEKLSVLWLTGSVKPPQENFISCLIRQKLIVAIDNLPFPEEKHSKKFLLFLPPGEKQELTLLFLHYLLKARKHQVTYIGQDIHILDLKDACSIRSQDYVLTMITETFTKIPVQKYIDEIAQHISGSQILLSGYQVATQPVKCPSNVTIFPSLQPILQFLEELKSQERPIFSINSELSPN